MAQPGFTICVSSDPALARAKIDAALAAEAPGAGWERHAYWGDEPLPDSFWEHLTLAGLFASPKIVLVHNAQNILADTWKKISQALGTPNAETWPFFILNVAFERGKPKIPAHIGKLACMAFAEKRGWLWVLPGLDERSKPAFVRDQAAQRGLSFAPGALEAILPLLPTDATSICSELDKLGLASPSGSITREAAAILDKDVAIDVFALIRDLQRGGNPLAVWEQALAANRTSDALLFPFLATLTREARQLWQIAHGQPVRLPPQVLSVKTSLARSLGPSGIARLWHLALDADKGVKTGERSPEQALECLFASLSLLFRPSGHGHR